MTRSVAISLVAAVLAAAGCGDDQPAPPADLSSGQSAQDLHDRAFASTAVTENDEPRTLAPDTRVTITFVRDDDRDIVRWEAGCNTTGLEAQIMAERLVTGEGASTTLGCSPERREQDQWLLTFFESDPEWRLNGDRLTLTSGESVIESSATGG